jgi:hypothetical protein
MLIHEYKYVSVKIYHNFGWKLIHTLTENICPFGIELEIHPLYDSE